MLSFSIREWSSFLFISLNISFSKGFKDYVRASNNLQTVCKLKQIGINDGLVD